MAGSSGAVITDYFDQGHGLLVAKTGGARELEQGAWLSARKSRALPRVYSMLFDGYLMERLVEFTGHTPEMVYDCLRDSVWPEASYNMKSALVEFDRYELSRRLARAIQCIDPTIAHAYQLTNIVTECIGILDASWHAQLNRHGFAPLVSTHGDPTMENVMYRRGQGEGLVLIDPLPPRPYSPSLREVDLGKIMQSLVGFEVDRYQTGTTDLTVARSWLAYVCGEEELSPQIVLWWTVVHILRTFPYMDTATRTRLLRNSLNNTLALITEDRHARGF